MSEPRDLPDSEARTEVAPLHPPLAPLAPHAEAAVTSSESVELIAGRYELLGLLGSGGMGTVYRARDRELDEVVALKVLKKELAAAPGMLERFRREVKLARRVTHRNVARTFDIGEHGGDRFLTMELVDGEMLGARVARKGRLGATEALLIMRDVCDGLAAAHAAGVLHRDLKPENVIIAGDGRAMITDFGIARAVTEAEAGRTVGGIIGTPAYMAPEQVEGAPDLDGRTDLYALGAMLYEVLTGVLPWTGDSVIAIAAARLMRPPPDPRGIVPSLTDAVAELVLRLMARRREDRFASADDARTAIGALVDASSSPRMSLPVPSMAIRATGTKKTIAVLPLLALGSPDDAYLADGVTEDLVDLLSNIPELRARPRGETIRYSDATRDVREIGRILGVDVVVDGSVRRIGDSVRITVRLVTVEDGFQLWAGRFDRAAAEVLTVADQAAHAIVKALAARDVVAIAPRHAPIDPIAQDLYLRARHLVGRGWTNVNEEAVVLLEQAHDKAPGDARIGGLLALAKARTFGNGPTVTAGREALALADKILALEPNQPEARVARGMMHLYNAEGAAAAMELKSVLEVAPNNISALDSLGRLLCEVDRVDLGISYLERALAHEPDRAATRATIARTRALRGDFTVVEELLVDLPAHPGDLTFQLLTAARIVLWQRDEDLARTTLDRIRMINLPPAGIAPIHGFLRIGIERTFNDVAKAAIDDELPLDDSYTPRRVTFAATMRVEILLVCGRNDEAIELLRFADARGHCDIVWLDGCPLIAPLRSRPEFSAIRASVALRATRIAQTVDS